MQNTLYIPIEVTNNNPFECEKLVKRGDTVVLNIKVFSNGSLANLTGQSIDLILRKSDGTLIQKEIDTNNISNGTVTAKLDIQATVVAGLVSGELQLSDSNGQNSTNTFTFNVSTSVADNVIEISKNDINILNELRQLIANGEAVIAQYEEHILAIANSIEAIEALENIKSYIDTNLAALENNNAQAVVNTNNLKVENDKAPGLTTSLKAENDDATSNISTLTTKNQEAVANKNNIDSSISVANTSKIALDTSNTNATNTKNALDTLNTTATNTKNALNTVNQTGQVLLNSLEEFEQEHADVTDISNQLASVNTQLSENTQNIEKNANKLTTYDNRNHIGNLDYSLCRIKSGLDIAINGSVFTLATGKYILNNIEKTTKGKLNVYNAQITFSTGSSIKDPFIIEEDGIYYMFYSSFISSSLGDISLATSTDLESWANVGIVVNHSNCWGGASLPVWAPWVSKKQEDGYYYMFVCGVQPYTSGYLRSTSLANGWEWQNKVKDSTGVNIAAIDPSIYEEDGIFYMVLANQSDMGLDLYSSNSLSSNSWTYVKQILSLEKTWEGGLIEAGQIIKLNNNEYCLVYGGSSSSSNQRIGLATSNKINGDYIRRGRDGMIFLPIPQGYGNSLAHPHLMYIESKKAYYLFACVSDSNSIFHIIGYKSKDLSGFEPINKATTIPIGNSILYISPNNDLVMSSKIPYDNGNDSYFIDGRIGCILLGTLTNNNGTLTFAKFRLYETITAMTAKKETDQLTYTTPANLYGYLTAKLPTYDMRRNSGKLVAKIIINIKNTANTVNIKVLSDGTEVNGLSIVVSGAHASMTTYTSSWVDYTNYVAYVNTILVSAYCDGTGNFILSDDSSIAFAIEY